MEEKSLILSFCSISEKRGRIQRTQWEEWGHPIYPAWEVSALGAAHTEHRKWKWGQTCLSSRQGQMPTEKSTPYHMRLGPACTQKTAWCILLQSSNDKWIDGRGKKKVEKHFWVRFGIWVDRVFSWDHFQMFWWTTTKLLNKKHLRSFHSFSTTQNGKTHGDI